jgi:hypothetical protein
MGTRRTRATQHKCGSRRVVRDARVEPQVTGPGAVNRPGLVQVDSTRTIEHCNLACICPIVSKRLCDKRESCGEEHAE